MASSSTGTERTAPGVTGDAEGEARRRMPFVLGIVGDSGSGKSVVASGVRALLGEERVSDLRLDDYHRFTRSERAERGLTALNPMVHDFALMHEHLQLLRAGRQVRNRSYDHSDGTFGPIRTIEPRDVVIVSGLLGFPTDDLRDDYDLAVFLEPEPELLYRWKLRQDVRSRGYKEAEVLKIIVQHLLDSKEYVLPQAERADLVVRYVLPDPDAPDSEVRASLLARRKVAEVLRTGSAFEAFRGKVRLESQGEEVVLHIAPDLSTEVVHAWTRQRFPATFDPDRLGVHMDDQGGISGRAQLMLLQTIIARLTELLRRFEEPVRV